MKVTEFKGMSKDELKNNLRKKTEELYELKVKNKLGQLANPLTIRAIKKDIARVLTVLNANKGKETTTEVTKPAKVAKATKKAPKAAAAKVTKAKKVTKAGASRARK
jgi:large subunit ribosomal protein L29